MRAKSLEKEMREEFKRRPDAHKGDFGKVFILAGSQGYTGAAHLAGMGAMRAGAGLVTVGVPEKIYAVIARREAEVMVRPFASTQHGSMAFRARTAIQKFLESQTVLALGPGFSQVPETQKLVRSVARTAKIPKVLDADALNAYKGCAKLLKDLPGPTVVTPHTGEFVRLFGGPRPVSARERLARAAEAARKYSVTVVLKGQGTVTASPAGKTFVNTTGNPGMASGGTGDVLTGIIAAFLGQGLTDWSAARYGVYAHGLAGDLAAAEKGMTGLVASDLLEFLPAALKKILGT